MTYSGYVEVVDFRVDKWLKPHEPEWVSFRFRVDKPEDFNEALAAVKRLRLDERRYDPQTRRWSVLVSQHSTMLLSAAFDNYASEMATAMTQMALWP